MRKSTDRIELNSKLGYKTGGNWNYAGLISFKSQFAPGFNFPRTDGDSYISKFLAPAYINVALGMDFKKDYISVFISPLTGKLQLLATTISLLPAVLGSIREKSSEAKWGEASGWLLRRKW